MTSSGTSTPPRARWSARKKLCLELALLPLILLGVEAGYRTWLWARSRPYRPSEAEAALRSIVDGMTQVDWARANPDAEAGGEAETEIFLHPYFGFEVAYGLEQFAEESRYFRSGEDESYDIVVLGGSVACMFIQRSGNRFIDLLHADPRLADKHIRLIVHARGGFKEPQQLNIAAYAFALGYRPEAVLNIDGFNELALSNYNASRGVHPAQPSLSHWGHITKRYEIDAAAIELASDMLATREAAQRLVERTLALRAHHSAILGRAALALVRHERDRFIDSFHRYEQHLTSEGTSPAIRGPRFPPGFDSVLATCVTTWSESSRSLQAICDARSVLYVHVLQPTLLDQGSKPLTASESHREAPPAWRRAIRFGYPLLREAGASLRADGVNFVDGSMIFRDVEEELYEDACHFSTAGTDRLAEAAAKAFLELLPDASAPAAPASTNGQDDQ